MEILIEERDVRCCREQDKMEIQRFTIHKPTVANKTTSITESLPLHQI